MMAYLKALSSKRMLVNLLLGFSSGMPFLLTGSTLQAWMTDEKVDLTVIGMFSLVGLPYTFKFVWAPLLDRYVPPFLGRRRGWLTIIQVALAVVIVALSFIRPGENATEVAVLAVLTAFLSASQDIVADAYRRESLSDAELGIGASVFVLGYRLALLFSGAFALFLADQMPWSTVYQLLASAMAVMAVVSFWADEPKVEFGIPHTLREMVLDPFLEYFRRPGAWTILVFILLYKIGDNMAGAMTTPFVLGMGFTKTEYAGIVKTLGLGSLLVGGFLGGALQIRMGMNRALWIGGVLQAVSTLGFSFLAVQGPHLSALTLVVCIENLTAGMGSSVFTALMGSLTNKRFTATQYALLSSLMGVPRVIAAAPTGWLAKELGWSWFFLACTLAALPGILLLSQFAPWSKARGPGSEPVT